MRTAFMRRGCRAANDPGYNARLRRCGRVVECTGLENRRRGNPSVSSNLTASARKGGGNPVSSRTYGVFVFSGPSNSPSASSVSRLGERFRPMARQSPSRFVPLESVSTFVTLAGGIVNDPYSYRAINPLWNLVDPLSVEDAAALIAGVDPHSIDETRKYFRDPESNMTDSSGIAWVRTAQTALANAVMAKHLNATIRRTAWQRGWDEEPGE